MAALDTTFIDMGRRRVYFFGEDTTFYVPGKHYKTAEKVIAEHDVITVYISPRVTFSFPKASAFPIKNKLYCAVYSPRKISRRHNRRLKT